MSLLQQFTLPLEGRLVDFREPTHCDISFYHPRSGGEVDFRSIEGVALMHDQHADERPAFEQSATTIMVKMMATSIGDAARSETVLGTQLRSFGAAAQHAR
ncbi:unnamed protein product [Amoebophrya sp. A25]|nr:unnamed protein product [Amoebophrya sp. A25]|eukprot:GSA25T00020324001.1